MRSDIALSHVEAAYDPAKARDYYLKTRELKGRRPGASEATSVRPTAKAAVPVGPKKASQINLIGKTKQAAVDKRLGEQTAALRGRIKQLTGVLKQLLAKSKDKGTSSEKPKSSSPKKSITKSSDRKELTSKQKAEAQTRAKDFYEKNKPPPKKVDKSDNVEEQIKEVRAKLKQLRSELKSIVQNARAKPKTAR